MFDPTYPPTNALIESAPLRGQFNSLKALIDAMVSVNAAVVDGVTTLPPGDPATVSLNVVANMMHFTFGIPQGHTGAEGPQGLPGEVTQTDLNNAVATMLGESSNNSNGVGSIAMNVDPDYNQTQIQMIVDKLEELINALRR
ncbi:MAG: hypothetical protein IPK22_22280 [Verrucomicrobiaceae bacterium]|nr:hypothetical protein [Verrucomicrobiaceae bacterium]